MTTLHNLGYPRIGGQRELKFQLEKYWKKAVSRDELEQTARQIRQQNWQTQLEAGIELLPVNDFAYYDQMLNMSTLLGCIPSRFRQAEYDLDIAFRMARGQAPSDEAEHCCHGAHDTSACTMKKWFDTNYHYIVPEFEADTTFQLTDTRLFDEILEAQALDSQGNVKLKPVLIGPLTYLYLGKNAGYTGEKLDLLDSLLPVYQQILEKLAQLGIDWVQIDEPILTLELGQAWQAGFEKAYQALANTPVKILLATYFDTLGDNFNWVKNLPVAGLHYDGVRGKAQLDTVVRNYPADKVLSLGLVEGRNIWITDLENALQTLNAAVESRSADYLWIAPSCSLLHVPVDLDLETKLNPELKSYLSFAKQKLQEVSLLHRALKGQDVQVELAEQSQKVRNRAQSSLIHNPAVAQRMQQLDTIANHRPLPYAERAPLQHQKHHQKLLPTTTIGSFPQTQEIRQTRRAFKNGDIDESRYIEAMKKEIAYVVEQQEILDIDVLVHGEPERNDMVEYFGEQLDGYAFTQYGWVQSYGSRCVKPPIIYGDVSRPQPMTVFWSTYAQNLTPRPMKGMLTGPVTMLQWSFVRDDQPRQTTCEQIALALLDEVQDLEKAGITIIQIDEPALREGLPLKQSQWQDYLNWSVNAFRLCTSSVQNSTQIHTHMCYSEFNDIIEDIAAMDADVITIETSKSRMELLQAFSDFRYPNEIGPGVYDIHSPNIPTVEQMVTLIEKAAETIPVERLWVNPDCGLKTRGWAETLPALENMVKAAKTLRAKHSADQTA